MSGREDAFAGRSILGSMLRIALPLTFGAAVRYGADVANAYWIGKLGVTALSIVTALGTFLSLSKMFAGLTSAGTSAVLGRMMGEGEELRATHAAQKVTALALVLGAVVAMVGFAVSEYALDALAFAGDGRAEARRYLAVQLGSLPLGFGMMAMNGALVGLGLPRASVVSSVASFLVSCGVTPLLVHVAGTGVWGAAAAQSVGDACGYALGLRALALHAGASGALPWRARFAKVSELWPVFRVGAPLTFDAVVHGTVWFALVAFLARYGDAYVAAQGTEERLTQVLNVPNEGIAPAAATLVGYMLGRGRRDEARRVVRLAIAFVATVSLGGAVLLRLTPAPVVAWICNDPSFVHVGVQVLAIASFGLVFMGGRDVYEAAFGGIGDAVPAVAIGLAVAMIRFPLAYFFAVHLGKGGLGVAWAVNATIALQTLALGAAFRLRLPARGTPPRARAGEPASTSPGASPS